MRKILLPVVLCFILMPCFAHAGFMNIWGNFEEGDPFGGSSFTGFMDMDFYYYGGSEPPAIGDVGDAILTWGFDGSTASVLRDFTFSMTNGDGLSVDYGFSDIASVFHYVHHITLTFADGNSLYTRLGSPPDFTWGRATFEYEGADQEGFIWYEEVPNTATPIPGAAWLLGSGLVGLVGIRRKMKD